ncbi:MAG TPA: isoleucine--tRNA ligase, partial [Chitinophagaceae bacterium]|nr:isoleucine--tRNA ligase [Chitinophagaceae bacterium]
MKKYKEFEGLNLPVIEKEILQQWQQEKAFEKSISLREGSTPFVFYEGPPSANGMPGIHHVISRTLKDLVCRYKTMQGFQVKRKGGWDTHGLPVELGVEKELGITKEDIGKKISVAEYNQKCREAVLRYKKEWDDITTKMGYWVDLKEPYVTFENNYIESLWWLLKKLYNRGLLYESVSIQPYSPAAGTGLSSHELNQPGTYKDVKDTSATILFKVKENEKNKFQNIEGNIFFMAWTTTPWTLPSNLGLTVGANIDYVLVKTFNPFTHKIIHVIIAKALLGKYFKAEDENGDFENYQPENKKLPWQIIATFKGSELENVEYEQLLPFSANTLSVIKEQTPNAKPFRVLLGDFVTTEDGTGIVHTAPAFGADDFRVGKKYDIGILTMVDKRGKFLTGIEDGIFLYGEEYVKEAYLTEAEKETEFKKQKQILETNEKVKDLKKYLSVDDRIVLKLQEEGKLFKKEKYDHNYPHCWRTDKPILYYPLDAWFIKTTALKDRMVELNKTINWKPKSTGEGRFGNWLENMVDWNLSRSRYWGTPLPVWCTEDGDEQICIGSIAELEANLHPNSPVKNITDLHKPQVDEVILQSSRGKEMKRVPDLVDVWFDSGAMPYAQWHFPFENVKTFTENYPADFIAEGVDQTRGWFYTLHAIGSLIKEDIIEELKNQGYSENTIEQVKGVAYKTVVSNGLVLDKNGNKMSKRLGNVVNPFDTIEKFGADATRWYLITNASPWDNLKFDIEGIKEVQRKFFGTLYNTYQFFVLYANVDGFAFEEKYIPLADRPEIDRWILSSLNTLIEKCTSAMNDYEPTASGRLIEEFTDEHLSNWYVRLSRRRFWKGEYEHDKICAYQTLYECLETIMQLIAPISPFFSDAVFQNLNAVTKRFNASSIHHVSYPTSNANAIDKDLEERMQLAQNTCSLVLSIRKKSNIKVRQPLQKIMIPVLNPTMKIQLEKVEDLIKSEVNIKDIQYLTATEGVIKKKAKANFKTLGTKLGANMKDAANIISNFSQQQIAELEKSGSLNIQLSNSEYQLTVSDVEIVAEDIPGWSVASNSSVTVALDITITEALQSEGDAREFVNRVQNIRKESNFELTDRIF